MASVDQAMAAYLRRDFLPADVKSLAEWDNALPIGFGQTISQPSLVGQMLEWLEVEPGNRILDVGSGSGWTTAILAHLTGPKGKVWAVEIIPELKDFGQANCRRHNIKNANFHLAGAKIGWPAKAPYDRILVGAAANKLPDELTSQLKENGKMVVPINNEIWEIEKRIGGQLDINKHYGFIFVPLLDPSSGL